MKATRTCSVADCDRPHYAHDLCNLHDQRRRRHGSADVTLKPRDAICSVDGCGRKHHANGYCKTHDGQVRRAGVPGAILPVGTWRSKGDEAGYHAAHRRVDRLKGKASDHSCAHCGSPAADWAYDHTDPNEKTGVDGRGERRYSTDPTHYIALCRPCHRRFDHAQ